MKRWWWTVAACAGATDGAPTFAVLESQGAYGNPNDTPASERRPVPPPGAGFVSLSPIPGESGVSNTSSVLRGGGSGGGGGR